MHLAKEVKGKKGFYDYLHKWIENLISFSKTMMMACKLLNLDIFLPWDPL